MMLALDYFEYLIVTRGWEYIAHFIFWPEEYVVESPGEAEKKRKRALAVRYRDAYVYDDA